MIDLHCHLPPGADVGARVVDEALSMARVASGNGIGHSIVTPHIHPGRYEDCALGIDSGWGLVFDNPMAIVQAQFDRSGESAGASMLKMRAVCLPAQQQSRY